MKTAVITGAGSGVGRAIALKLAEPGLARGHRRTARRDAAGNHPPGGRLQRHASRIMSATSATRRPWQRVGRRVLAEFGEVEVLVNAAGTNAPRRALEVLSLEDYHAMIDTNLNGAYYCVQAFLPQMRARKSGTIVNIVSDAGKQASPKAGPAYVMSKFGLAGLDAKHQRRGTRQRRSRLRAFSPATLTRRCSNKRPVPPDAAARAKMMRPEDVADCALLCINLPPQRHRRGNARAPEMTTAGAPSTLFHMRQHLGATT